MFRSIATAVVISCALAPSAASQKVKVDSLLIVIPRPKAAVIDIVLIAFAEQSLDVTENSGSTITSDQGTTKNTFTGVKYSRAVRALVLAPDSIMTRVLITATEAQDAKIGGMKRKRIDNQSRGTAAKLWCQMVRVAMSLDSVQVSQDAKALDICSKDT